MRREVSSVHTRFLALGPRARRDLFFFFAGFAEGKARCNYAAALPFHPSLFSVTVCQILGSSVSVSEILGTFFCRFGCTKSRTGASQTIQTAL